MQTNVLQSMLHRNSTAIFNLECEIKEEKAIISHYKGTGRHKDYFNFRYSRLEKMRRELAALVKIQRALKDEIYFQHGSDNFFRKVAESVQSKEWLGVLP